LSDFSIFILIFLFFYKYLLYNPTSRRHSGLLLSHEKRTTPEIAKRQLMSLGVPEQKIILENKSINTEQNAKFTKKLLEEHNLQRPILVTSAFHMERAVRNFKANDIRIQAYPTDYQYGPKLILEPNQFTPSFQPATFLAIKEYVGITALSF
jgi:uncharacterized SAM-binding protein YcdF (DUF218 family)